MSDRAFTAEELRDAPAPLFAEPRVVRFQDIDAAGIVFYPRVLEYFSDAYLTMLVARGYDLPRELARATVGYPLVHAEADYLRPLRYGDAIKVEVISPRLGDTSFRVGYRLKTESGHPAAIGQTVHVAIDRSTFKPCPIPAEIRRALGG